MSRIEYVEQPVYQPWLMDDIVNAKPSEEFYQSLMSQIDMAAGSATVTTKKPLSDDSDVNGLMKETVENAFSTGTIDLTDSYAILDDEDKAQFAALVTKFLEAIEAEEEDQSKHGLAQELINRLFPEKNVTVIDPYQEIRDKLTELQEAGVSAQSVTQTIIPMLINASLAQTTTEAETDYGSVILGNKKITLEDLEKAMQEMAAIIAEVDAGTLPELPPEEIPVEGEVGEVGETPSTGENVGGTELPEGTTGTGEADVTDPATQTPIPETPEVTEQIPDTQTPPVTEPAEPEAQLPAEENTAQTIPEVTEQTIPEQIPESIESVSFEGNGAELFSQGSISRASARIQSNDNELDEISVASAMTNAPVSQTITEAPAFTEETASSVQSQTVQFIEGQLSSLADNTTSEMTMVLNPENLGQLTVQVASRDGEITIRIAAQSEQTQELLRDRLPSLMQSLMDVNSSLREIQIVEPQSMTNMEFNLSGNGAQQQYASQNGYAAQQSAQTAAEEISDEEIMKGANRLWQTA